GRSGGRWVGAAGCKVARDVRPFAMVAGDRARLVGANTVGLERRGFSGESIEALKRAFRSLFYSRLTRQDAISKVLERDGKFPEVRRLVDFIGASKRGVVGRERD